MKVVLAAVGSEGDVAPVVSIGHELSVRGHEVVVVALERYAETVGAAGLRLEPIRSSDSPLWPGSPVLRRLALAQSGAMFAAMLGSFRRLAPHTTSALLQAADGADVLVSGTATRGACGVLSQHSGARHLSVLYAPLLPADDPASTCSGIPALGKAVTHASSRVMWRLTRALGAAHTLQMGRHLRGGGARREASPVLVATSPLVSPPWPGWPDWVEQVGWIRSTMGRAAVPHEVESFLAAGPPPVLMTFGSSPAVLPSRDHTLFLSAARRSGVRLLAPGVPPHARYTSDEAMFTGAMDFEKLLPRVAAVVHHGGAGTTYTTLAAGVPAVVVPHLGDQAYYARRVEELGVGVRASQRWRLRAAPLARMVDAALTEPVRHRAATLAESLRSERNGASLVADRIEASAASA